MKRFIPFLLVTALMSSTALAQVNPTPVVFHESKPVVLLDSTTTPITDFGPAPEDGVGSVNDSYSLPLDLTGYRSLTVMITNLQTACVDNPLHPDCNGKTYRYGCGSITVSAYGSNSANNIRMGTFNIGGQTYAYPAVGTVTLTGTGNTTGQIGGLPSFARLRVRINENTDALAGCKAIVAVVARAEDYTAATDVGAKDSLNRLLVVDPNLPDYNPATDYNVAVSTASACVGPAGTSQCGVVGDLTGKKVRVFCTVDAYYHADATVSTATTSHTYLAARTVDEFIMGSTYGSLGFITSTGSGVCQVTVRAAQ